MFPAASDCLQSGYLKTSLIAHQNPSSVLADFPVEQVVRSSSTDS